MQDKYGSIIEKLEALDNYQAVKILATLKDYNEAMSRLESDIQSETRNQREATSIIKDLNEEKRELEKQLKEYESVDINTRINDKTNFNLLSSQIIQINEDIDKEQKEYYKATDALKKHKTDVTNLMLEVRKYVNETILHEKEDKILTYEEKEELTEYTEKFIEKFYDYKSPHFYQNKYAVTVEDKKKAFRQLLHSELNVNNNRHNNPRTKIDTSDPILGSMFIMAYREYIKNNNSKTILDFVSGKGDLSLHVFDSPEYYLIKEKLHIK